jgi:release factor glutamine methyltransferase
MSAVDQRRSTIGATLQRLARAFRTAGIETPDLDARRLVGAATGLAAERLFLDADTPVSSAATQTVQSYEERRLAGEPVARIMGCREFYGRDFIVTPDVLDPRADTECVVDAALAAIDRVLKDGITPIRIVDVGVGSGCILATLVAERPSITGVGLDISNSALAIAAANISALGLRQRARTSFGSASDIGAWNAQIIVSNPPYIRSVEIAALARDVRDFDPIVALDGGEDGLDVYRDLFSALGRASFVPIVIVEVGHDQADAVVELGYRLWLSSTMLSTERLTDLGGRGRCVVFSPHPAQTQKKHLDGGHK